MEYAAAQISVEGTSCFPGSSDPQRSVDLYTPWPVETLPASPAVPQERSGEVSEVLTLQGAGSCQRAHMGPCWEKHGSSGYNGS